MEGATHINTVKLKQVVSASSRTDLSMIMRFHTNLLTGFQTDHDELNEYLNSLNSIL